MAEANALIENFSEFSGLDLRSHDVERKPRFARDSENVQLIENGSLSWRKGRAGKALDQGGGGIETYVRQNDDRSVTSEIIGIDEELWRAAETSLNLRYVGSGDNPAVSIIPVDNEDGTYSMHLYLYVEDTEVLDVDLGTALDDASPDTITSVVTTIDALADWGATVTGDGTTPAAFLEPIISASVPTAALGEVTTAMYWEQVYCPTSTPFADFWDTFGSDVFENACLFNHNNLLLIATGFGKLYKYDGVSLFAAGMPSTEELAAVSGGAGSLTGTYRYIVTYQQIDAVGNVIEGDASNEVELVLSSNDVDLTIPTIEDDTEFLHSFAYAANGGTQTGTVLTVDDGAAGDHTLQVGQTALFRDNAGTLQELEITARSSTTITVGTSVTIANNAAISANLRINLYRNKSGDANKYLVRSFANPPDVASISYTDDTADDDLGETYSAPVGGHTAPREDIRYLTTFDNILVMSDGNGSQVFVSDFDGPEYRNDGYDYILLRSKTNLGVSALGANRDVLAIFKPSETHVVQGNLAAGNYRLELAGSHIGCDSHASVKDVNGALWFYSGDNGVHRVISSQVPDELSYRILPTFLASPSDVEERLVHKRAVAFNMSPHEQYLLNVPCETDNETIIYPNTNSVTYVADYSSQAEPDNDYDREGRLRASRPKIRWWKWVDYDFQGGACLHEGDAYFMHRRFSDDLGDVQHILAKEQDRHDVTDYHDFAQPFDAYYESGWDDLGNPDQEKNFISATIYSFDDESSPAFNFTAQTEIDFRNGGRHSEKEFESESDGGGNGWGDGPWGDFVWGELEENRRIFPFKPTRARALKLVFLATVFLSRSVISGWVIQAVPAFRPKQAK